MSPKVMSGKHGRPSKALGPVDEKLLELLEKKRQPMVHILKVEQLEDTLFCSACWEPQETESL